jgi:hypothetical protein
VFVDVMDGADIGMIECGGGFGLAPESFECGVILREPLWQKLEGDEAMELGIFSLVHHAHAPAAQLLQNPVMGHGLANHSCSTHFRSCLAQSYAVDQLCEG